MKAQGEIQLEPSTLAHSLKDRYVIRAQHGSVGHLKFVPPSHAEAKSTIKTPVMHPLGDS